MIISAWNDASPHHTISTLFLMNTILTIISNLFDNNHLYALSTHKSKMCEQNVSYLVKDLELEAKKLNRTCHKNCSKSSKMAITVSKFLKTFRGSIPPNPPRAIFLFLNLLQINFPEKNTLKKCKNFMPPSTALRIF